MPKKKKIDFRSINTMDAKLAGLGINTICKESLCPNISECYSRNQATFLILGDRCTRNCSFCNVLYADPIPPDETEAARIVGAVKRLGLRYVILTSPSRDDLADGGAKIFAESVRRLKKHCSHITVELLIPDFKGSETALDEVAFSSAEIIGHNMETVKELYNLRSGADYKRSLQVIEYLSSQDLPCRTKSGFMLGMGEKEEEVAALITDIASTGCDILTMGQYLPPSRTNAPLKAYITDEQFSHFREIALDKGISEVISGFYVRSSYRADIYSGSVKKNI